VFQVTLPHLLSFLATGNWSGQVQGIDNIQSLYAQVYGPGSYTPIIPVTYWSFRLMIGIGMLAALVALIQLWTLRKGRTPRSRWLLGAAIILPLLPLLANSLGWLFTEMGRQPWLVFGQMKTAAGVSSNSAGEVLTSLIVLTALYGVLAVIETGLLLQAIRNGLPSVSPPAPDVDDRPMSLVY